MNILITGGAGFVGSHCAEYYAGQKARVMVVDNLMRSAIFGSSRKSVEYNWDYLGHVKNVTLVKKDVRDAAGMKKLFKQFKPDAVIHTAGQPGVRFSLEDPTEDFTINAAGTLSVLEALRYANPKGKFVYCSTNKVYGDRVNALPIRSICESCDLMRSACAEVTITISTFFPGSTP